MNWATIGRWALKIGIYAIGHEAVIAQTVADAKAKNVGGLVGDAAGLIPTGAPNAAPIAEAVQTVGLAAPVVTQMEGIILPKP